MSSTWDDQQDNDKANLFTYFEILDPWRNSIIEQHRFYVDQGKNKLLSQFGNMEHEADKAAERWLEQQSKHFDPDRDDPGSVEEDAYHEGVEYYRLLSELRDQTRLSIIAGMYHSWDKELRRWLLKEIEHWHRGRNIREMVWRATLEEIVELLVTSELAKHSADYIQKLSACRYVVNVYKHGEGLSLEKLKIRHPEYLRAQLIDGSISDMRSIDHTHLLVTDKQLDEFSSSIVEFWRMIPRRVRADTLNVPAWFEKAMERDHKLNRS